MLKGPGRVAWNKSTDETIIHEDLIDYFCRNLMHFHHKAMSFQDYKINGSEKNLNKKGVNSL